MIAVPFANHPRARLERLVREGFERIERYAAVKQESPNWFRPPHQGALSSYDFQVLMAADAYLRSTAGENK